jgi:hypothetical protein
MKDMKVVKVMKKNFFEKERSSSCPSFPFMAFMSDFGA